MHHTYSSHASIYHKIGSIDKAAFVARQEQHSLSLLDSLAKTAGRKVDLPPMALGRIVSEPVLKKRSALDNQLFCL